MKMKEGRMRARKAQAWQAEKHMEAYCKRRDEDHEQHLGYSRKDGTLALSLPSFYPLSFS
jgi:hypothetical protein